MVRTYGWMNGEFDELLFLFSVGKCIVCKSLDESKPDICYATFQAFTATCKQNAARQGDLIKNAFNFFLRMKRRVAQQVEVVNRPIVSQYNACQ